MPCVSAIDRNGNKTLVLYTDKDQVPHVADIAADTTAVLLPGGKMPDDICFADTQTAYTEVDQKVVCLRAGSGNWTAEVVGLSESSGYIEQTENGLLLLKYSNENKIYGLKGQEFILLTDAFTQASVYAVADDLSMIAWITNKGEIFCVNGPGTAAQKVADKARNAELGVADGKVYFIMSDEPTLCSAAPDGTTEKVAENVRSFKIIVR